MYLAGVSVRRVEDITQALWGTKVSPGTISNLNQKAYVHIEEWRQRKLTEEYPYVYVDGVYLKRSWGGEVKNVSVLIAIGIDRDGYRQIFGAKEGMKEDHESVVPNSKIRQVTLMLKAIHAQESKEAARAKAVDVVAKLRAMRLTSAANKIEAGIEETLTYMDFPTEHWNRLRTNNVPERINREIKRRTRVIGAFPDGNSALMLVCARLRYVASSVWGSKRYLMMDHLFQMEMQRQLETSTAEVS